MPSCYHFDRFTLDPVDRTLHRDGRPIAIPARYLDALALMVADAGRLVTKDRFMAEVWRGVPVTDEALTQCIRTLRRTLGDDAARPRFIETVPKHGYRFVAAVAELGEAEPLPPAVTRDRPGWPQLLAMAGAGTVGAGVAGVAGGLVYGSVGAAQPLPGGGAASVLLVLLWVTIAAALTGGAGVSLGIAAARGRGWAVAGGAIGGMIVGGTVKLLGLDAFNLLLGRSPVGITGAWEGLVLGGSVGLGAWLADRMPPTLPWPRRAGVAALAGAAGAVGIVLLGGRLMAGSLDLLARTFPQSRLRLDGIGAVFGDTGLGGVGHLVTAALEGGLFAGCVVGAMLLAGRPTSPPPPPSTG